MYFTCTLAVSTRAISQYLVHRKIFKSYMSLFINGLKNFGVLFKEISENYMPKTLNSSDK